MRRWWWWYLSVTLGWLVDGVERVIRMVNKSLEQVFEILTG